jgi:hypothetical protein
MLGHMQVEAPDHKGRLEERLRENFVGIRRAENVGLVLILMKLKILGVIFPLFYEDLPYQFAQLLNTEVHHKYQ